MTIALAFIKSRIFLFLLFLFVLYNSSYAASEKRKTLVAFLAEARAAELTYENIKTNLLDVLDADLAVCIGITDDYQYSNPFYQKAKYKFVYKEPSDYGEAFDYAYETISNDNPAADNLFPWRNFLKIKDHLLGGVKDHHDQHPGSAGILIFYRWLLLKNIVDNNLLDEYDFFVITRSDYIYKLPHPEIDLFSNHLIYIPDGEAYGGVTDRHVVLPKKFVIPYLNMLNKMILNGEDYYKKMEPSTDWNLERFIDFHLKENNIRQYVRFFPYIMYTVRPIGGSTRWAGGTFSEQHNYYIKYPTEYKSACEIEEAFNKSRSPLDRFYRKRISLN